MKVGENISKEAKLDRQKMTEETLKVDKDKHKEDLNSSQNDFDLENLKKATIWVLGSSIYLNTTHYENDLGELENEISSYACKVKIFLACDFYSRIGQNPHYILNDSTDLNNLNWDDNILPISYSIDEVFFLNNLLHMCLSSKFRILNGRYIGDSLGYYTYLTVNGLSAVGYAIISNSLLSSVLYFMNRDFDSLSDHAQLKLICKYNPKSFSEIPRNGKTKG
ncbi:unnamed protein product [Mytilus coruscus]|uniref:Uncharacterized protein n=1 Tax=Mytilus coruscus TaxID=42192 RepID=A0A6J8DQW7_MYTCO|nr:unnamed protein product [Mytilus coruscus]